MRSFVALGVATALSLEPAVAAAATASATPLALAGPSAAMPASLYKPKKKKKGGSKKKKKAKKPEVKKGPDLTPNDAEAKRDAIRDAAQADVDAGDYASAAQSMEENAALLGDPISFLEGADLRIRAAEKDRDIAQAEAAIESAEVAGDIAGFYEAVDAGTQSSDWLVIDPVSAGDVSQRAEETKARARALIEEIEAEKPDEPVASAGGGSAGKVKKKRDPAGPGTALIAAGSAFTVVGVGGLSLAIAGLVISSQKQKEVEDAVLPAEQDKVERLDKEGSRANVLAFVGAGVAVVGLGVGIPLVIIGAKRRKEAKSAPASASLRLAPKVSRRTAGLVLTGHF
jgi:hypothetical protein